MKIDAKSGDRFCQQDHPELLAVLLYGPDRGRIIERQKQLVQAVIGEAGDPFLETRLDAAEVRSRPGALIEESQQLSLMGGRRAVLLSDVGDAHLKAFGALLDEPHQAPALVIATAGELGPRSKLRQLFEKHDKGAAVATYADTAQSLSKVIEARVQAAGYRLSAGARSLLVAGLGADRQTSQQELEKLLLYMASEPPGTSIEPDHVQACLSLAVETEADAPILFALEGKMAPALTAYHRLLEEGVDSAQILPVAWRSLERLALFVEDIKHGATIDQVIRTAQPPLFFSKRDTYKRLLHRWQRSERLVEALHTISTATLSSRQSTMPTPWLVERAIMRLAALKP